MILITPDKGLTGPLNSNLIRRASRYILNEAGVPVRVIAAGKKGRDFMIRDAAGRRRGVHRAWR